MINSFYLLVFTSIFLLVSCGDSELDSLSSLDSIFVESEQTKAEMSIATELTNTEITFGRYMGPETSLTFLINHSTDTKSIKFYHSSYCNGEPVLVLDVHNTRSSSRVTFDEINLGEMNYFSAQSFGEYDESEGCSNTIKFFQSETASSFDVMLSVSAENEQCQLEGEGLQGLSTNCQNIVFDFSTINESIRDPLESVHYFSTSDCSGEVIKTFTFSEEPFQDTYTIPSEGQNLNSMKYRNTRSEQECVMFEVTKDTTPPTFPEEFDVSSPGTKKIYQNNTLVEVLVTQISPEENGDLALFDNSDCSGAPISEVTTTAEDTNISLELNAASNTLGVKELFLKLGDYFGNEMCFGDQGISYEVVATPTASLISSSPSSGENIELQVEGVILGSQISVYSEENCAGEVWTQIDSALSEQLTITDLTLDFGGTYHFSFAATNSNSETGCVNLLDTLDVQWREPTVTTSSAAWNANPTFTLSNISASIPANDQIVLNLYANDNCTGAPVQSETNLNSGVINITKADSIEAEGTVDFSFDYEYSDIKSGCSSALIFNYDLPSIELLDTASLNVLNGDSQDPYLRLRLQEIDSSINQIISLHPDSSCLLKGYGQKFVPAGTESYNSGTLEQFFRDGPRQYSVFGRYENLDSGAVTCEHLGKVNIEFIEVNQEFNFALIDPYSHYKLIDNIDFSAISHAPIGSDENPFQGHFFGNGKKIENLEMITGDEDYLGFFGVLGNDSVVYELIFEGANIQNQSTNLDLATGILAAKGSGVIERVFIDGSSTINGKDNTGGLIGVAWGATIRLCENEASVQGDKNVGGLVGHLDGPDRIILPAEFSPMSVIVNSLSLGAVNGDENVGGLVGKDNGLIGYSYSAGNVNGDTNVGGLVGYIDVYEASIFNTFSSSTVTGNVNVAGLVGLNTQKGSVNAITENSWHMSNNCYNYKPDDPQVMASCEGASSQLAAADVIDNGACTLVNFDCVGAFYTTSGDLPRINRQGISDPTTIGLSGGTGLRSDPLVVNNISEWQGLESFGQHSSLYLELSTDFNFGTGANAYAPLNNRLKTSHFTGVIDGLHYTLNDINFTQANTATQYYGILVGSSFGGEVKNLHWKNTIFNGHPYSSLVSSYSHGGRFKGLSFDNVSYSFDGNYTSLVSSGLALGDVIRDVSVTNSSLEKNAVYNGSYIGFIQSHAIHSVVSDISIKGSSIFDHADKSILFVGMVSGRSLSKNSYDSLSIEADISVQNPNDYYGGVIGWAWEGSVIKNSLITGEIDGGRKYLGGLAGGSRIFYSENNISAVDIFGAEGAYYCSGISGYNYKNGNEHHSIYIKKSVYLASIFCDGGTDYDPETFSTTDDFNFGFNHYHSTSNMKFNFWLDDTSDDADSCYRKDVTSELNAPCAYVSDLPAVGESSYSAGSLELFFDYYLFLNTNDNGAEFSEQYWLKLKGQWPRVRGH